MPVIAGASGGAPDAVIEGVTGFVVNGTDTNQISDRVVELLANEELRKKMGSAGREWIVKEWRWQIWAEKFALLLAG